MIRKILIANRGEIAIRIAHSLREMEITSVAVFTEPDAQSLHVRIADECVQIASYLDPAEIVRTAKAAGAEAIHPGYGFLSENPKLSQACEEAGVIFIGPRPDTIRRMGDKLESKRLMSEAGVPTVPRFDREPPADEYPVLVKAVGGGGGKGMRLVERPADLADAMASASREAASAFGNDRVFVEKYIRNPRHIEFQILGDSHGNCVHIFERECSIQRRHQKIVEESPSVAVTLELRERMGAAAVAAARAVNYRGAGTVEFILDPAGQFYFLEMNTRLQVEHPVTEMITGLDLVREQVLVASGEPLSFRQLDLHPVGHALECRIYAEVPEENFRPSTGRIEVFRPPAGPGIRLDSGIEEGSLVTYHFDPMLAKLIVWSSTRAASIDRMSRALDDFVLLGVQHNVEFLRRVITSEPFKAGNLSTHFLESNPELFQRPYGIPDEILLAASLSPLLLSSNDERVAAVAPGEGSATPWTSGPWRNA
ncbi:MAG: ATP-grasp domain-containing protein [Acidobacteria bacterium]|nr:ATP-grasp domain-containing protein [Acidobacteriota bacterium]